MDGLKRRLLSTASISKEDNLKEEDNCIEGQNPFFENIDITLGDMPSQVYSMSASKQESKGLKRKFRGRPKRSLGDEMYSWPDHAILLLIKQWQKFDVLYNPKNPNYHVKEVMEEAIENICFVFREHSITVTPKQVTNKMLSLKNYFCKERAKVNQSKRLNENHETANVYKVNWRFFEPMQFLDECIVPKPSYAQQENNLLPSFTNPHLSNSPVDELRELESSLNNACNQSSSSSLQYEKAKGSKELPHNNQINGNELSQKDRVNTINSGNKEYCLEKDAKIHSQPQMKVDLRNDCLINIPGRDEDDVFCELILRMLKKLPPGQSKELLKINIQHMIVQASFRDTSSIEHTRSPVADISTPFVQANFRNGSSGDSIQSPLREYTSV